MADFDIGTDHLHFDREPPLAWCSVDNPTRRNALTPEMYYVLNRAVEEFEGDSELRAMILTGVGDVFIPGGDMATDAKPSTEVASVEGYKFPFEALRRCRKPVVAAINGVCQASGVLIAVMADVAVASDPSTFRFPELRRGVAGMWTGVLLPHFVGMARARELSRTAAGLTRTKRWR